MTFRTLYLVRLLAFSLFLGAGARQMATAADPPHYALISRGDAAGPYQAFPDVCRLPDGKLARLPCTNLAQIR